MSFFDIRTPVLSPLSYYLIFIVYAKLASGDAIGDRQPSHPFPIDLKLKFVSEVRDLFLNESDELK